MGVLKTSQRLRRRAIFTQIIPVADDRKREDRRVKTEPVSQRRGKTEAFTSESILSIYPRCSNPPAPAGHKHTCFRTVLLLAEASNPKKKPRYDLSQKPFVFGQDAPSVFHRYIQSPPVELHHGNAELEPAHQTLCQQTVAP